MRLSALSLLFCFASLAHGALKYLPANDSQPLIRRDLILLDVDAIEELAGQLAIIADGPFPKSASRVRHRVQTLTLCQRLFPSQSRAREIEAASLKAQNRPAPDANDLKTAGTALLTTTEWLTQMPADSEGHLLGQLLLDILQPLVPDHPVLKNRKVKEAPQRWDRVIADLTRFESEDLPPKPIRPKPTGSGPDRYLATALLTEVPLISKGLEENAQPAPGLVTTTLVLTQTSFLESEDKNEEPTERAPGQLLFKPRTKFEVSPLHNALLDFFETHLSPLPPHYNLNINTNQRRYLAENQENIAAPIAMMLDSAVTGRPLRRNTILFARLRASGKLEKPAKAWDLLLRLEQLQLPTKTRLIVGSGMREELTALLVLGKASFFNDFEVIEAHTFEDARQLYFQDGKMPLELQAASDGYLEVREKADLANNLSEFLAHSSVESRLVKARDFSPRHLSAAMLAQQAIRRPAYFTRYMAARDLDRRLEPTSHFRFVIDETSEKDVKEVYKDARILVDPIEKHLKLGEKELLNEAVSLLKKLNSVDRNVSPDPDNRQFGWKRNVQAFQDRLSEFRGKLQQVPSEDPIENE